MHEHYVQIEKKLSSKTNFHNDKNHIKFLGHRQLSSIYLRLTDEREVFELTADLNYRKASGYIDVPVILIIMKSKYLIF